MLWDACHLQLITKGFTISLLLLRCDIVIINHNRELSYSLICAVNGKMVQITFQLLLLLTALMAISLLILIYGSLLVHNTRTMKLKGPYPQRCNNGSLSNGNWMDDSIPEKPILWPDVSSLLPPQPPPLHTTTAPQPHSSNNTVTDSSLSQDSDWQGRGLIPNHFVAWHDKDSSTGWDGPTCFYCRAGGSCLFMGFGNWGFSLSLNFKLSYIKFLNLIRESMIEL